MRLKDRFKKKKVEEEIIEEEIEEPPTRTKIMVGLFLDWGSNPFSCGELVGTNTLGRDCGVAGGDGGVRPPAFGGWNLATWGVVWTWTGCVDIQHNNVTVLHIEPGSTHRATIYVEEYSDRLGDFINALRQAIKDRDDAVKAKRIKEETQF